MEKLQPKVGLRSASFLVVSVIIGSGVFKKIVPMSASLGSPTWVILCWVFAGLISIAGALSTAELVSMYPNSGGEYYYFQKIYGKFFAFLYGWSSFAIIKTAAISALAYIFAQSLNSLFHFPVWGDAHASFLGIHLFENLSIKIVASILIVLLTFLNFKGLEFAEKLSNYLTFTMLLGIGIFIVYGLTSSKGDILNLQTHAATLPELKGADLLKGLFIASLGAFWGYEGWNNIAYIGEEIKEPQKNLPLALLYGTLIVITSYVLLNIVFFYIMPIDAFLQMGPNSIAAVEVAQKMSGSLGAIAVAILILTTTLNSTNSTIMMSARMVYAMARDKVFFSKAAHVHPTYNTPDTALFIQAFWAIALLFSGSFDQLTDMLIFASFLFYGSSALGVIIMRYKAPDVERKYKVIGYPVVPLLFCLFCATLFINTIIHQTGEAMWGLLLMFLGVPMYIWFNKKARQ
jgi:APA family basic amino acid/polyamine antiporter